MIDFIDNICDIIARFIVRVLDWFIRLSRLAEISIEDLIKGSCNILDVRTHAWNKKYIDTLDINEFGLKCNICNITISQALYCSEELSLTCKEQQIKNLLE